MRRSLLIAVACFAAALAVALVAHAGNIASPITRPAVTSVRVDAFSVQRDSTVAIFVAAHFSDGTEHSYRLDRVNSGTCQGLRLTASGEPEVYTGTPSATCATDTWNSFKNASGAPAQRLDAVDSADTTAGRLPP
jgi:hypothetical protein